MQALYILVKPRSVCVCTTTPDTIRTCNMVRCTKTEIEEGFFHALAPGVEDAPSVGNGLLQMRPSSASELTRSHLMSAMKVTSSWSLETRTYCAPRMLCAFHHERTRSDTFATKTLLTKNEQELIQISVTARDAPVGTRFCSSRFAHLAMFCSTH